MRNHALIIYTCAASEHLLHGYNIPFAMQVIILISGTVLYSELLSLGFAIYLKFN